MHERRQAVAVARRRRDDRLEPVVARLVHMVRLGRGEEEWHHAAEEIVDAVCRATAAKLRVDANAGWSRERALQIIPRLADYGLEFIEQPLPKTLTREESWSR